MMKKLAIAICDDDETALIAIRGTLSGILEKLSVQATVDAFTSPQQLGGAAGAGEYDLLFLDIEMPGIDGITLGQDIRSVGKGTEIIYVSNREDLVFETFKVHPFGFVRKSRFIKDISEVMRLYVETHKSPTETDIVTLKSHGSEVSLACDSIVYVEGVRDYQYIHISDGEPVRLRESMSALLLQLEPLGFIRIHKGYIVNFKYIRRIDATSVTLTDGTELPLSRRSVEPVRAKYMQLCRSYGFVRLN